MAVDSKVVIEGVTGVVQAAQGGIETGYSSNGFETYSNLVNLAGTIAGTTPPLVNSVNLLLNTI